MQEERKERLKQKRKLREKGLLRSRWDNEKEVFNDNELLSVSRAAKVLVCAQSSFVNDLMGTWDWD